MQKYMRWLRTGNLTLAGVALLMLAIGVVLLMSGDALAADEESVETPRLSSPQPGGQMPASAQGMAFIAAAIAVGLSSIAGGLAVGMSNAAAMGAIAERPELIGRLLIFVALAEGIAIYGLVVAILIIMKV